MSIVKRNLSIKKEQIIFCGGLLWGSVTRPRFFGKAYFVRPLRGRARMTRAGVADGNGRGGGVLFGMIMRWKYLEIVCSCKSEILR
jgi:hypothetical protein